MKKKGTDRLSKAIQKLHIEARSNKSALSYRVGEEMVFTFKMKFGSIKPGKWFLQYTRHGDDNQESCGKVPADQMLTVRTSMNQPGFVHIYVVLVDENGKTVFFDYTLPNGKKMKRGICYDAGGAAEPEKLTDCGEPDDFDAFWAKQKKRLAKVPFAGKVDRKLVRKTRTGSIYAVSIPAPGPRPATGYLTIPDAAGTGSLPVQISFYGYGNLKQKVPRYVSVRQIRFYMNAHGQELGREPGYYERFFASIGTPGYTYAFDPEQNKNPETCFFNGMVMRILRSLEYLKSLPEWDGVNLIASGGSQGGLQTMWAAALDPAVTSAVHLVTWCCDLAGQEKAGRLAGPWRLKYVPALDYYDPVFMAKRIKKASVVITRAGLGDYVCPPSGLMLCYKNLATPKKSIRWVQGSTHGVIPKKSEVIVWTIQ